MVLETQRYPKDKTRRWRLIFQSDFTKSAAWSETQLDKYKSFTMDGYLHIVVCVSKRFYFVNPGIILDDFRAQVDIEMSSESASGADYGLAFKSGEENSDNDFFLLSAISRVGVYCLHREGKEDLGRYVTGKSQN